MVVFGGFRVFARVVVSVFRDVLTHLVSSLDEVLPQESITRLGLATLFGFEVAGVSAGPP